VAEINYTKSFLGSERQFAESYQGHNYVHNTPAKIYLSGWSKAYTKTYIGQYTKSYSKSYLAQYSKEYEGSFNKTYLGNYTKTYTGQYTGTFTGIYEGTFNKQYEGQYTGNFEGTFNKQYEGTFNKAYSGQYTGPQRYNNKTIGNFIGTFNKQFEKHYAESGSPYIKTYTGLYTKTYSGTYLGQYTKTYTGLYEGSFNKEYEGQFTATWVGQYTDTRSAIVPTVRTSNVLYSGAYEQVYTHIYVGEYSKEYEGSFHKLWSGTYQGTFKGLFTRTWLGQYDKTYLGQYSGLFQKNYVGERIAYYSHIYNHNYVGVYQKVYLGQFTKSYLPTGNVPASNYQKEFTGPGYVRQIERIFLPGSQFDIFDESAYVGTTDHTFNTSYVSSYIQDNNWMNDLGLQYQGGTAPAGFTNYIATVNAWVAGPNWVGPGNATYQGDLLGLNYVQGTPNPTGQNVGKYSFFMGAYNKNTAVNYIGGSSPLGYFLNTFEATFSQFRYFTGINQGRLPGQPTFKNYGGFRYWSKAYNKNYIGGIYTGGVYAGALSYSKMFTDGSFLGKGQKENLYVGQNPGEPPSPFPSPPGEGNTYEGVPLVYYVGNYEKNYILGPYERTYEGERAVNYIHVRTVGYTKNYSKNYVHSRPVQWEGLYEGTFHKQYEGGYDKQYEGSFNKNFSRLSAAVYTGTFIKVYLGDYEAGFSAGIATARNSTESFSGSYIGYFDGAQFTGYFDGLTYSGYFTKTYVGQYEGTFDKQYEGSFVGYFDKQYEGSFTRNYIKQWTKLYTGTFTGVYSGGPYDTQYTGSYTKSYTGQYTKTYTGIYSQLFSGLYTKTYTGQYEGSFDKQFEGSFDKTYIGAYVKTYTGIYIAQYTKGYIKHYTHQYEGSFNKAYIKTYGGAYSGAGPKNYSLAYFTNNYAGERTFHQSYTGTTSTQSLQSGNLTDSGKVRVKVDGVWKEVSRTRVKENGVWKTVQTTQVKDNGTFKTVAVDYDRVDINVTSNTNQFNLGSELTSLGLSLYSKPKHVNIVVDPGVTIYSDDINVPAFDTSLISQSRSVNHKVKITLKADANGPARIIGAGGDNGDYIAVGEDGGNGGDAILLRSPVELYIESYGIIAGGGGGGGSGGVGVHGAFEEYIIAGAGNGGKGAGYHSSVGGFVEESDSARSGNNGAIHYQLHGGDGGRLGQLGTAGGGFTHDNPARNESNPGTNYAQYANAGNGGIPGSAIKGYNASRVTFINSTESSVWGDSAFKFKA
jgi:hypothetical protein